MKRLLIALGALALILPAATPATAAPTSKQARDWTRTVSQTPDGGYRMGNPQAPVRVVEYGSISCPHCAAFSAEASQNIRARVRTGRVSWEYRPFMIFPSDPGIFMALGCGGAAGYFDRLEQLYAGQPRWLAALQANVAQFQGLPLAEMVPATVRAAGLVPYFNRSGLSPQRLNACLSDRAAVTRLATNQQRFPNITGTPAFFVNGQQVNVNNWAGLESYLR